MGSIYDISLYVSVTVGIKALVFNDIVSHETLGLKGFKVCLLNCRSSGTIHFLRGGAMALGFCGHSLSFIFFLIRLQILH